MGGLSVLALLGLYIFLAITVFNAAKTTSAKAIVLLLALLIPTADAIYGRIKLQQMCKAEGGLKVYRVAEHVEGFMGYADEEMITKYGYQFVESCDVSKNCYKFSKKNEDVVKEYKVTPKSKYRLRLIYGNNKDIYNHTQYIIEDIATSEVLATDTALAFRGGWVERFLDRLDGDVGDNVALCSNLPDSLIRIKNLIISTLKH
jgi:hypothetical protein